MAFGLAAVAAVVLVGVGAIAGSQIAGETEYRAVTGEGPTPKWSECANPSLAFVIGYPAGWDTETSEAGACLFLDPAQFEVPENSDFGGTAIEVIYAQQTFADTVHGFTDERFAEVVARKETTVAGRLAVVLETEATGEGLYDRGTLQYAYVIDRAGRAFVVQTTSVAGDDFEARKEAVDGAVRLLRFTESPPEGA